jgi:hypothetical protein
MYEHILTSFEKRPVYTVFQLSAFQHGQPASWVYLLQQMNISKTATHTHFNKKNIQPTKP